MKTNSTAFQREGRVNIVLHGIGLLIFKLLGWKAEGGPPANTEKYVAIVAPHTSYWDYPMALLYSWVVRMKGAWLGKSQIFDWPFLGWFFRKTGGIPVDRSKHQGLVGEAVRAFHDREELVLALTPEGTRAKVPYWKSGFYRIAVEADVPIALGFLDFKRKRAGIGPLYHCTGDVEKDLAFISAFYDTITPKHPEWRSEVRFRPEKRSTTDGYANEGNVPKAVGMR